MSIEDPADYSCRDFDGDINNCLSNNNCLYGDNERCMNYNDAKQRCKEIDDDKERCRNYHGICSWTGDTCVVYSEEDELEAEDELEEAEEELEEELEEEEELEAEEELEELEELEEVFETTANCSDIKVPDNCKETPGCYYSIDDDKCSFVNCEKRDRKHCDNKNCKFSDKKDVCMNRARLTMDCDLISDPDDCEAQSSGLCSWDKKNELCYFNPEIVVEPDCDDKSINDCFGTPGCTYRNKQCVQDNCANLDYKSCTYKSGCSWSDERCRDDVFDANCYPIKNKKDCQNAHCSWDNNTCKSPAIKELLQEGKHITKEQHNELIEEFRRARHEVKSISKRLSDLKHTDAKCRENSEEDDCQSPCRWREKALNNMFCRAQEQKEIEELEKRYMNILRYASNLQLRIAEVTIGHTNYQIKQAEKSLDKIKTVDEKCSSYLEEDCTDECEWKGDKCRAHQSYNEAKRKLEELRDELEKAQHIIDKTNKAIKQQEHILSKPDSVCGEAREAESCLKNKECLWNDELGCYHKKSDCSKYKGLGRSLHCIADDDCNWVIADKETGRMECQSVVEEKIPDVPCSEMDKDKCREYPSVCRWAKDHCVDITPPPTIRPFEALME